MTRADEVRKLEAEIKAYEESLIKANQQLTDLRRSCPHANKSSGWSSYSQDEWFECHDCLKFWWD